MSPLEAAVAAAELHDTASRMLQVEQMLLATMSGWEAITAQDYRVDCLQRVVTALGEKILSPVAEASS